MSMTRTGLEFKLMLLQQCRRRAPIHSTTRLCQAPARQAGSPLPQISSLSASAVGGAGFQTGRDFGVESQSAFDFAVAGHKFCTSGL
jgi:hypothetical protein